jgi:CspA family cold shock protein
VRPAGDPGTPSIFVGLFQPAAGSPGHAFSEVGMPTGTVKWFDTKKGFGFIVGPEGQDVFVHFSSIEGDGFRSLKDGESVDYDIARGDKGFSATRVKRMVAAASGAAPIPATLTSAVKAKGEGSGVRA